MDTTERITSLTACLSEQARGITGAIRRGSGIADITAAAGRDIGAAGIEDIAVVMKDTHVAMHGVDMSPMAMPAADTAVEECAAVDTEAAQCAVAAASTVVGPMAEADSTADAGNQVLL